MMHILICLLSKSTLLHISPVNIVSIVCHVILHDECNPQDMDGSKEEVAPLVQQLLMDKADLLKECFGVDVDSEGHVCALPQLIEGHSPDLNRLPYFVLQLARDVDWEEEKACFRGLAQVTRCC